MNLDFVYSAKVFCKVFFKSLKLKIDFTHT